MATDQVKVIATTTISHDGKTYNDGQELTVDAATAQQLVASGSARPSPTSESNDASLPITGSDQALRQQTAATKQQPPPPPPPAKKE